MESIIRALITIETINNIRTEIYSFCHMDKGNKVLC